MDISFTSNALEEFEYWIDNDQDIVARIKNLVKAIRQDPFKGIGKPEPLRYDLKGYWSRRVTGEHRIVYKISGTKGIDQRCIIVQCRFHYDD